MDSEGSWKMPVIVFVVVFAAIAGFVLGEMDGSSVSRAELRARQAECEVLRAQQASLSQQVESMKSKVAEAAPASAVPAASPVPVPAPSLPELASHEDKIASTKQADSEPIQDGRPIDKSEDVQKQRRDLIAKLTKEKVFKSYEKTSEDTVHLVVGSRFSSIDFDQKNSFVGVVFAYCFETSSSRNLILLYDPSTNKRIGSFSALHAGLSLD